MFLPTKRAETAKMRNQQKHEAANSRRVKPQKCGVLKPQICGALNKEEEVLKSRGSTEEKSSSARTTTLEQSGLNPPKDDDPPPSPPERTQKPKTIADALHAFVRASNIPSLSGGLPDDRIGLKLNEVGASVEDLELFLNDTYRRRWKNAPATWKHVETAVLGWLSDPKESRRREMDRLFRRAEELRRIAAEQKRQAEAQEKRELDEVLPPVAAIERARVHLRALPTLLEKSLVHIGCPVSAGGIIAEARSYKPCGRCKDTGLVGRALDRSRTFCACFAGEDAQRQDPDAPAKEIVGVHSSLKNRLLAGAEGFDNGWLMTALDSSDICDLPDHIEINPRGPAADAFLFDRNGTPQPNLQKAMAAIGETRLVLRAKVNGRVMHELNAGKNE